MRSGRTLRRAIVAGVVTLVVLPTGAAAQELELPPVPTTDLLPPLVPDEPAPAYDDVCGADGLHCVRYVEGQLAAWEQRFGCDHRAVFATVYRMLTRQTRLALEDDPAVFQDPAGLGFEALAFYELYEQMLTDHLAGRPIPPAWQRAMDAAQHGNWTGGHDMLLAISAHVNRDMPFAVARTGLVLPDGRSRKADHDQFNRVLAAAYGPIVREVGRRYDPIMTSVADVPLVDDAAAPQLVAGWREGVWRNAELVVATQGTQLEAATTQAIEATAVTWATLLRVGEVPGHRALRDAHCAAYLASRREQEPPPEVAPTEPPAAAPTPAPPGPGPAPTPAADPVVDDPVAAGPLPATGSGVGVAVLGIALAAGVTRRP